jgi:thiamine pyrophosphokinase
VSEPAALRAIVVGDGGATSRVALDAAWPGWDDGIGLVVAADGGARLAQRLRLPIDRWVGDGDSLDKDAIRGLRKAGIPVELVAAAKDESDLELALVAAIARGATDITILGALGGRLDHEVANLALLAHPRLAGRRARLLAGDARVTLLVARGTAARRGLTASASFAGRRGDVVTLQAVSDAVRGITTTGLRYPLAGGSLRLGPARGLSNVRTAAVATVTIGTGRLLVIETPARLRP